MSQKKLFFELLRNVQRSSFATVMTIIGTGAKNKGKKVDTIELAPRFPEQGNALVGIRKPIRMLHC